MGIARPATGHADDWFWPLGGATKRPMKSPTMPPNPAATNKTAAKTAREAKTPARKPVNDPAVAEIERPLVSAMPIATYVPNGRIPRAPRIDPPFAPRLCLAQAFAAFGNDASDLQS
jgi:hypothetical protein